MNSIAVLPFANLSVEPDNEYFSDGIAEELLNALTKIRGIRVASRTSSFAFKNKHSDIREIGSRLNVGYILEGSVRRIGENVRISVQLTQVEDGFLKWSQSYSRKVEDAFRIQQEIAHTIANKFRETVEEVALPGPSVDPEAYDLFLKGRYHWYKYSHENMDKATDYFQRAIKLDPDFAPAYSGLANAKIVLRVMGFSTDLAIMEEAKELTMKAIKLDNTLTDAYITLGMLRLFHDRDYEGSANALEKAISLTPSSGTAHHIYAQHFLAIRDYRNALHEAELAVKYDPLAVTQLKSLGYIYFASGNPQQALKEFDKALSVDPNFRPAYDNKGWVYAHLGEWEKAFSMFRTYHKMVNHPLKGLMGLGYAYAKNGQIDQAMNCLQKLRERRQSDSDLSLDLDFATIYMGLGNIEKALEHIDQGLYNRVAVVLSTALTDPNFETLRKDPAFEALLEKYKLAHLLHSHQRDSAGLVYMQTLETDTKETLTLDLANLVYVEAQDNYSYFVWKEQHETKTKLLRANLSKIEAQIEAAFIVRCHRSYLVNLNHAFTLSGNAAGYKLTPKDSSITIPVSRTKSKRVLELLQRPGTI